jgi:hypothetical protein
MNRTILAAVLTVVALPAFASDTARSVAEHFNQDIDTPNEQILISDQGLTRGVTVSTRDSDALARAIDVHNASVDSVSDRIDGDMATLVRGTPAHGAAIFAEIDAAQDDD